MVVTWMGRGYEKWQNLLKTEFKANATVKIASSNETGSLTDVGADSFRGLLQNPITRGNVLPRQTQDITNTQPAVSMPGHCISIVSVIACNRSMIWSFVWNTPICFLFYHLVYLIVYNDEFPFYFDFHHLNLALLEPHYCILLAFCYCSHQINI